MAPRKDPWPDTDKLITYAFPVVHEQWPGQQGGPKIPSLGGVHLYVIDPEDTYRLGAKNFTRGWWMFVGVPTGSDDRYGTPGAHTVAIRRTRFKTRSIPDDQRDVWDIASTLPDSKGGAEGTFEYMPWSHEIVATSPGSMRQVDLDLLGEIFLPIAFKAYNAAVAWFDRGAFRYDNWGRMSVPVIRP